MGQYYYTVAPKKKEYLHPHKLGDGLKLMEFGGSGLGTMFALGLLISEREVFGKDAERIPELFGSWAGSRIVIAGDYADEGKFLELVREPAKAHHAAETEPLGADEAVLRLDRFDDTPLPRPSAETEEDGGDKSMNLHLYAGEHFTSISNDMILAVREFDGSHPFGQMDESARGWRDKSEGDPAVYDGPPAYIYNFDKNECITPAKFGDDPVAMNFLAGRDGITTGLAVLLADGNGRGGGDLYSDHPVIGSWAGDRIAIRAGTPPDDAVDVSDSVIDAIIDGEGDWSPLTFMDREQEPRVRPTWEEMQTLRQRARESIPA